MGIKRITSFVLQDFGFISIDDFVQSTFQVKNINFVLVYSMIATSIQYYCEQFMGLAPTLYLSFLLLIAIEFITGIKASIKEGNKIESKKFGRFIFKIAVYSFMIGIVNTFKQNLSPIELFGATFDIYKTIHYVVLNMISIQLLISVFENLDRLGYKESFGIYKVIRNLFNKFLAEGLDKNKNSNNEHNN
jgi:phage-related holin